MQLNKVEDLKNLTTENVINHSIGIDIEATQGRNEVNTLRERAMKALLTLAMQSPDVNMNRVRPYLANTSVKANLRKNTKKPEGVNEAKVELLSMVHILENMVEKLTKDQK